MKNILFNNLKEFVFGPPVSKLFEMEPGITVENIYSQYLSQGGFKLVQIRSQLQSGVECGGLGVDRDPRIALIKALSEYFERKAVLVADELLGFNSTNGVASHRFSLLAKHAAYFELAERDAFLAHWYSRSPFEKVDDIPSRLIGILRSIDANNLKTLFFVTNLGFEKATVCFIVDKTSGGFAVGLSAGRGRSDIEKALQEAIINFELGGYSSSKEQLLEDYDKNGITSLQAHRVYWLYKSILPDWILKGRPSKKLQPAFKIPKTTFIQLAQKPFKVFGAKNEAMLPLVVGLPTKNYLTSLTHRVKFDTKCRGEWLIHPIP